MRTTLNLDEDVLLLARQVAQRERLSLGEAVSRLARNGANRPPTPLRTQPPKGRFALLGARDEVITPAHIRELMDSEGI